MSQRSSQETNGAGDAVGAPADTRPQEAVRSRLAGITSVEESAWACEWVRPGGMGIERYEGTAKVFAPDRETAIERARIQVSRHMCFARSEVQIRNVVQS